MNAFRSYDRCFSASRLHFYFCHYSARHRCLNSAATHLGCMLLGKLPECSAAPRQKSKLSTFNGQIWAVFPGTSFYYFYTLDKIGVLMEWISLRAAPFFGRCLHRLRVSSCSQSCSWAPSLSALNTSRNNTPWGSPVSCLLFFTCIWDKNAK